MQPTRTSMNFFEEALFPEPEDRLYSLTEAVDLHRQGFETFLVHCACCGKQGARLRAGHFCSETCRTAAKHSGNPMLTFKCRQHLKTENDPIHPVPPTAEHTSTPQRSPGFCFHDIKAELQRRKSAHPELFEDPTSVPTEQIKGPTLPSCSSARYDFKFETDQLDLSRHVNRHALKAVHALIKIYGGFIAQELEDHLLAHGHRFEDSFLLPVSHLLSAQGIRHLVLRFRKVNGKKVRIKLVEIEMLGGGDCLLLPEIKCDDRMKSKRKK